MDQPTLDAIRVQYAYATIAQNGFDPSELLKDTHLLLGELEKLQLYRSALSAIRAYLENDQNITLCSCDKCTNIRILLDSVDNLEKQC